MARSCTRSIPQRALYLAVVLGALAAFTTPGTSLAGEASPAAELSGAPDAAPSGQVNDSAGGMTFTPGIHERFRVVGLSDFPVHEEGTRHGRTDWGEHRLRLSPKLAWETLEIHLEVDAISGQIFGATSALAAPWLDRPYDEVPNVRWVDPRQLNLRWRTPIGMLQVGQVASHWGLGLLANDGAHDEDDLFSDPRNGDLVDRVLFVTSPLAAFTSAPWARKIFLGVGADLVFRDSQADLIEGDRAWQGVASLFWKDDSLFGGLYVAHRVQEDRESRGTSLDVTALDGAFSWQLTAEDAVLAVKVAAETALLVGRSDRATSAWSGDEMDVLALGALARVDVEAAQLGLGGRLDLGYASGDRNRADEESHAFTMDADLHAGMILFEEVLAWTTAAGAERAADPSRVDQPREGLNQLPTEGAIQNALFLAPTLRYRPAFGLDSALGLVMAFSPAGAFEPVNSARQGAYPTNAYGGAAESWSYMGTELDARLGYQLDLLGDALSIACGVQGGLFLPGPAFDGPGDETLGNLYKVRGTFDLRWN